MPKKRMKTQRLCNLLSLEYGIRLFSVGNKNLRKIVRQLTCFRKEEDEDEASFEALWSSEQVFQVRSICDQRCPSGVAEEFTELSFYTDLTILRRSPLRFEF